MALLFRVNPKSEIRNPKQIRMTKIQISKLWWHKPVHFENSDFEFVSDFGFRISDFLSCEVA